MTERECNCIHVCTYVRMTVCTYDYMYVWLCVYICMRVCTYECVQQYVWLHVWLYAVRRYAIAFSRYTAVVSRYAVRRYAVAFSWYAVVVSRYSVVWSQSVESVCSCIQSVYSCSQSFADIDLITMLIIIFWMS